MPGSGDDMRREAAMELSDISARNLLKGTVTSIELGAIMAEVTVDIGGQEVVAAITRASVERMKLAVGQPVVAIIKSTEVMLGRE
jgi:molybdate transport system regulatory protein